MTAKERNNKEKEKLAFWGTQIGLFPAWPIFILMAGFPISILSLSKFHCEFIFFSEFIFKEF